MSAVHGSGLALGLGLVAASTAACTSAAPPPMETCRPATGLDAVSVRLFQHDGDELLDGSRVPEVSGPGGPHWVFDLLVSAEGAGDCVDVALELRAGSRDAPVAESFSGGVRSRIVATGVRTSQIVLSPVPVSPSDVPVFATATAYGATRTVRLCLGLDCGRGIDAGLGGRLDAPFFFDTPEPDAPFFDTDAPFAERDAPVEDGRDAP
jgi:hypothetical protein